VRCGEYAKEKCRPVFRDAWIGVEGGRKVDWREASKLMFWACAAERELGLGFGLDLMGSWADFRSRVEVTSYKGSELLGTVIKDG